MIIEKTLHKMFFYFGESYQFVRGLFIKKYQQELFAVLFLRLPDLFLNVAKTKCFQYIIDKE